MNEVLLRFSDYEITPVVISDAPAFFQLIEANRDFIKRYFQITAGMCHSLTATENYLRQKVKEANRRTFYVFKITKPKSEEIIGCLMLKNLDWRVPKGEFGYFIDKKNQGKGITSRAVGALTDYCFDELKLKKVYLRAAPENIGSRRVAEKNGFELEGRLKQEFRTENGDLVDVLYFGKLR